MKQRLNIFFTLISLFATSIVTVATSKDDHGSENLRNNNEAPRTYFVASNCPGSLSQERVTITNQSIVSPANLRFTDFGLPTPYLSVSSTYQFAGTVNGQQRNCVRSEVNDQGALLTVYTCSENGIVLCQTTFELAQ